MIKLEKSTKLCWKRRTCWRISISFFCYNVFNRFVLQNHWHMIRKPEHIWLRFHLTKFWCRRETISKWVSIGSLFRFYGIFQPSELGSHAKQTTQGVYPSMPNVKLAPANAHKVLCQRRMEGVKCREPILSERLVGCVNFRPGASIVCVNAQENIDP